MRERFGGHGVRDVTALGDVTVQIGQGGEGLLVLAPSATIESPRLWPRLITLCAISALRLSSTPLVP
jgi:hypothetical protein